MVSEEKKRFVSSGDEVAHLVKCGFVVTAIAHFTGQPATYTLEKGSTWSRLLGSR